MSARGIQEQSRQALRTGGPKNFYTKAEIDGILTEAMRDGRVSKAEVQVLNRLQSSGGWTYYDDKAFGRTQPFAAPTFSMFAGAELQRFLKSPQSALRAFKVEAKLLAVKVPLEQEVSGHKVTVRELTRQQDLRPDPTVGSPARRFEVKLDGQKLAPVTLGSDGRFFWPSLPYQTFPSIAAIARKALENP